MGADYKPDQKKVWIKGVDANNLYGNSMMQSLPEKGFEWVPVDDLGKIDWLAQTDTQPIGYILKVDLEYPPELHVAHNDLPLAPERIHVTENMISPKQVTIRSQYNIPRADLNAKLIPNLMNKKEYVLHYRNLKYYLQMGMKLTKVHCAIKFQQSPWMAKYIMKNQALRANAQNEFETEFFKLMNNAVFGKTCENTKKRTDIKLVND